MDVSSAQNSHFRASVPDPCVGEAFLWEVTFLWELDWSEQPGTPPGTQTGSEIPL